MVKERWLESQPQSVNFQSILLFSRVGLFSTVPHVPSPRKYNSGMGSFHVGERAPAQLYRVEREPGV